MHIKQITIQGFKSYKDQSFVDVPFNPHHNVIAILFVLSEKYSKLRAEDRQQLLHEGTGRGVMVAFVEIIFDNSDNRLPIDKTEVSIRRTIGLKKDEYRINNKSVPQREVVNLLESAGFSSSNPYYVVEQGKVARLTTMKDSERLSLLKEVAGTNVYDERRKESLKIMRTTNAKKKRIDDVIEFVEERISELEAEVKQLKVFQKLDKKRRSIEYNLYNKERIEAREKLEELDESRSTFHEKNALISQQIISLQTKVKEMRKQQQLARISLASKKKDEEILEEEKMKATTLTNKLHVELEGLNDNEISQRKSRQKLEKEVGKLEKSIGKVNDDLSRVEPKLQKAGERENSLKKELAAAEVRSKELRVKQGGRKEAFRSQIERDNWLKGQIKDSKKSSKKSRAHIEELLAKVGSVQKETKENERSLARREKELESQLKRKAKELEENVRNLRDERSELTTLRKEKWIEQNNLEKKVISLNEQVSQKEKELESKFSRNISRGIKSIRQIINERNIQGIHGTVIENFKTKEKFRKPVEVTAGNRLFNIIVDTDQTAKQIIEIMNDGNYPGRVTLIPLNKLQYLNLPREIKDPSKSVSLMKVISYKKELEKAFIHIFGKTYLCKSLQIATKFSNDYGVDSVTLGGEQVSRKGNITGGWIDPTGSRLDIMDQVRNLKREKTQEEENFEKLKGLIEQEIGANIAKVAQQLNRAEPQLRNVKNQIVQEQEELRELQNKNKLVEEQVRGYERQIEQVQVTLEEIQRKEEAFRNELKTPYEGSRLSDSEERELESLPEKIQKWQKELVSLAKKKTLHENLANKLRTRLNTNLAVRKEEIQQQLDQMANRTENLDEGEKKKQLQELEKELESLSEREKELRSEVERLQRQTKNYEEETEKLIAKERRKRRDINKKGIQLEQLLNSKKILERKENGAISKIRELGTIPSNVQRYEDRPMKVLIKSLQKVKLKLKEIGHVNKQSINQHEQFTKQLDDFNLKKKELDEGAKAITNLIKTLDRKKNEAITLTFKQVSTHFKEIFSQLVEGGSAQLIMNEIADDEEQQTENSGEEDEDKMSDVEDEQDLSNLEKEAQRVEKFTGISIRVQFGARVDSQLMQQLSGGQKTLVALTLIFAIQKCDPAPFYLFDEIDSALDSAYRTAIANMLSEQAHDEENPIQFITTTFKNELVDVADQWYKIQYSNKVSKIIPIDKEGARRVLREQEGKVGRRRRRKKKREEPEPDEDKMEVGEDDEINLPESEDEENKDDNLRESDEDGDVEMEDK